MPRYFVEVQHKNDFVKDGSWFILEEANNPAHANRLLDFFNGWRTRPITGVRYQSGMGYHGRPLRIRCEL